MQHFHDLGLTHGNLKGVRVDGANRAGCGCDTVTAKSTDFHLPQANVLVDASGLVRLTDYGLARINMGISFIENESTTRNARWLAPEIIRPPDDAPIRVFESKEGDVFAFGMVSIQTYTGKKPLEEVADPKVTNMIFKGKRPKYPPNALKVGLTTPIFNYFQRCWDQDPTSRPKIDDVVRTLKGFIENEECVEKPVIATIFSLTSSHQFRDREPTPSLPEVEEPPTQPADDLATTREGSSENEEYV